MLFQVIYTKILESPWLFRKKALNPTQDKKSHFFGHKEIKLQMVYSKRGVVRANGADGIKIILALVSDLYVWDN